MLIRFLKNGKCALMNIKAIDQLHREIPDNVAQIFRNDDTVQQNLQFFTDDKRNNKNRLVNYFSDKQSQT